MAAAGIMGGASAINFLQAGAQARATNRFNSDRYEVNKQEALRAMVLEFSGNQTRINEERLSAEQAIRQITAEAREAVGTSVASNTTVEGTSVDDLLRDYERQELIRLGVSEQQLRINTGRILQGQEEANARAQSRISAGFGQPVAVPNLLQGVIQIGTSAFGGYLQAGGGQVGGGQVGGGPVGGGQVGGTQK
jgi:hypothetical protein